MKLKSDYLENALVPPAKAKVSLRFQTEQGIGTAINSFESKSMDVSRNLVNGEWQGAPHLVGYRAEWLSNLMVERATWDSNAPAHLLGDQIIANPGYVWLRFWLLEESLVLEKYFDAQQEMIGYHLPICMPVKRHNDQLQALSLYLSLWLTPDGRVTVLNEAQFDAAVTRGDVAPVEAEHAEYQIRELTTVIARSNFPPAIVRNFALQADIDR